MGAVGLNFYRKLGRTSIAFGRRSGLRAAIFQFPLSFLTAILPLDRSIFNKSQRNRIDDS